MKKLALAFCVLSLVAIAAIAEDAPAAVSSISAQVYTGFYYNAGDKTIVAGDSDNLGDDTSRINLTGLYSLGDFGAKFTFRAANINNTSWKADTIAARRAFAWYKFLGGKAYFAAGMLGIGDFGTTWNGYVAFDNAVSGVAATLKPIEGLELGYMVPISSTATSATKQFKASTIAVSYEIPKIATIQAWMRNFANLDGLNPEVVADVNVSAVEGLTLSAELAYNDATDGDDTVSYVTDAYNFTEQVAYALGKITPSLIATQSIYKDNDLVFTLNPNLAYALSDNIEVGAEFTYNSKYLTTDATSVIDAYAKFTLGNNYIKVKPGYDSAEDKGLFVRAVFDAEF
jgi:hypothetical protein